MASPKDRPKTKRSPFRLVHRDKARDHSNTETGEDAPDDVERDGERTHLKGDTEGEDQARGDDAPFAPEDVTHRSL